MSASPIPVRILPSTGIEVNEKAPHHERSPARLLFVIWCPQNMVIVSYYETFFNEKLNIFH